MFNKQLFKINKIQITKHNCVFKKKAFIKEFFQIHTLFFLKIISKICFELIASKFYLVEKFFESFLVNEY
jgi:hypothetical protein